MLLNGDAEIVAGGQAVGVLSPGDAFGHQSSGEDHVRLRSRNHATVLVMEDRRLQGCSESCQLRFNRALLHGLVERLSMPARPDAVDDDGRRH